MELLSQLSGEDKLAVADTMDLWINIQHDELLALMKRLDGLDPQDGLFNDLDADGNIIKAAPTFDYIENKAIEEEHRKGKLGKQSVEPHIYPALALIRGPGQKNLIPSSDGTTCGIEIDNIPYCSFCRKPCHVETECFKKNPKRQG
jgi:hypothetical protein